MKAYKTYVNADYLNFSIYIREDFFGNYLILLLNLYAFFAKFLGYLKFSIKWHSFDFLDLISDNLWHKLVKPV